MSCVYVFQNTLRYQKEVGTACTAKIEVPEHGTTRTRPLKVTCQPDV